MKSKIIHLAKEQRKAEKELAKQIKGYTNLLNKAGAKLYDSPETIDNKILDYVKNIRGGYHKIKLSKAQTNNPVFMEKLYNTEPIMTAYYPIDPENIEHQKNVDLMFAYLTNSFRAKASFTEVNFSIEELEDILQNYYIAATNPAFIEKLIHEYHTFPILQASSDIVDMHTLFSSNDIEAKGKKDFENCVNGLSFEALKKQIDMFGSNTLTFISKNHPLYNKLSEYINTNSSTLQTNQPVKIEVDINVQTQFPFTKPQIECEDDEPQM